MTKLGVSNLLLPEIYICSRVHLAHVEYEIGIPIKRGFHFYWFWIERPSSSPSTQSQGSCMKFMTVFMGYTWAEVFNPFFKREKSRTVQWQKSQCVYFCKYYLRNSQKKYSLVCFILSKVLFKDIWNLNNLLGIGVFFISLTVLSWRKYGHLKRNSLFMVVCNFMLTHESLKAD